METPKYKIPLHSLQRSKTPGSMMNLSYQPLSERKKQSRGEEVPQREETPQERSGPKDNPPVEVVVEEEEAEANESPRDDE